jgi:hypothetical protein
MKKDDEKTDSLEKQADGPMLQAEVWAIKFATNLMYVEALEQLVERTHENTASEKAAAAAGEEPDSATKIESRILETTWKMLTKLKKFEC